MVLSQMRPITIGGIQLLLQVIDPLQEVLALEKFISKLRRRIFMMIAHELHISTFYSDNPQPGRLTQTGDDGINRNRDHCAHHNAVNEWERLCRNHLSRHHASTNPNHDPKPRPQTLRRDPSHPHHTILARRSQTLPTSQRPPHPPRAPLHRPVPPYLHNFLLRAPKHILTMRLPAPAVLHR
jgi:hypothetical protein